MRRYGLSARALLRAYSLASATQLRLASLYDSRWDFTLYGEGHLGLHLAEKLRGAVALYSFRLGGGDEQKARAVAHLERALAHWDGVVRITRPYRDMKLTHYDHNFFVANDRNLFHWALIRDEVAADVTIARAARDGE